MYILCISYVYLMYILCLSYVPGIRYANLMYSLCASYVYLMYILCISCVFATSLTTCNIYVIAICISFHLLRSNAFFPLLPSDR